jgi:hypothetical protein
VDREGEIRLIEKGGRVWMGEGRGIVDMKGQGIVHTQGGALWIGRGG